MAVKILIVAPILSESNHKELPINNVRGDTRLVFNLEVYARF
jgi:hypothetical protein